LLCVFEFFFNFWYQKFEKEKEKNIKKKKAFGSEWHAFERANDPKKLKVKVESFQKGELPLCIALWEISIYWGHILIYEYPS
jgi:hypothetical protein